MADGIVIVLNLTLRKAPGYPLSLFMTGIGGHQKQSMVGTNLNDAVSGFSDWLGQKIGPRFTVPSSLVNQFRR